MVVKLCLSHDVSLRTYNARTHATYLLLYSFYTHTFPSSTWCANMSEAYLCLAFFLITCASGHMPLYFVFPYSQNDNDLYVCARTIQKYERIVLTSTMPSEFFQQYFFQIQRFVEKHSIPPRWDVSNACRSLVVTVSSDLK